MGRMPGTRMKRELIGEPLDTLLVGDQVRERDTTKTGNSIQRKVSPIFPGWLPSTRPLDTKPSKLRVIRYEVSSFNGHSIMFVLPGPLNSLKHRNASARNRRTPGFVREMDAWTQIGCGRRFQ